MEMQEQSVSYTIELNKQTETGKFARLVKREQNKPYHETLKWALLCIHGVKNVSYDVVEYGPEFRFDIEFPNDRVDTRRQIKQTIDQYLL